MPDPSDRFGDSIDSYLALSNGGDNGEQALRNNTDDYQEEIKHGYQTASSTKDSLYSLPDIYHQAPTSYQPKLPNFVTTADPQYLYNYQTNLYYDIYSDTYSRLDEATMMYQIVDANAAAEASSYYTTNEPTSDEALRLVVLESQLLPVNNIILVDANGITIGRDRSWDRRLRLPEMAVSKYHCHIFSNSADIFQDTDNVADQEPASNFSIIDVGSQNGTFVNGERLSLTRSASPPYPLRHLDVISVGTTKFQVHEHTGSWPCEQCKSHNGNVIDIATTTQIKTPIEDAETNKHLTKNEREMARRDELKRMKQKYTDNKPNVKSNTSYVDRAEARRKQHGDNSPVHRSNDMDIDSYTPTQSSRTNERIGAENIGNKLLQKMGWKEGQGLGSTGSGIIDPIQAQYREGRAGLGSVQVEDAYSGKKGALELTRKRYNEQQ
ncbi:hypothetical protein INT44_000723 [Umbelopsis vinacea]|uniref:Uncharacterized protein n=1 Tax=Umbelopsis vinacea TaxID=44442 RepID=A0A8H7UQ54_9FUNG|nr:hypothetical protein INT44_000723 [Umbelopsis vinacea]